MNTQGPYTLVLNTPQTLKDPASNSQPSAAVQVQNSSVFVLSVLASGVAYTIQPFFAQTIPLQAEGAPIVVTAVQNLSVNSQASTITLVWLFRGEAPPMQDGSLTAQAVAAAIFGPPSSKLLQLTSITVPAGGQTNFNVTVPIGINALVIKTDIGSGSDPPVGSQLQFLSQVDPQVGDFAVFDSSGEATYAAVNVVSGAVNTIEAFNPSASAYVVDLTVFGFAAYADALRADHETYSVGGNNQWNGSLSSGASTVLTTAPPAGSVMRMHRFVADFGANTPATGGLYLADATETSIYGSINPRGVYSDDLQGQLVTTAVSVFNHTAVTAKFTLHADVIRWWQYTLTGLGDGILL